MFLFSEHYKRFVNYYLTTFLYIFKKNKILSTLSVLLNLVTNLTFIISLGIFVQIYISPKSVLKILSSNDYLKINIIDIDAIKIIIFIILILSITLKLISEFLIVKVCENSQKKLLHKMKMNQDFILSKKLNEPFFDSKKYILAIRGLSVFEKFVTGLLVSLLIFLALIAVLFFYNLSIFLIIFLSLFSLSPIIIYISLKIIRRIRDIRSNSREYRFNLIDDNNDKKDISLKNYESSQKLFGLQLFLSKIRVMFGFIFLLFLSLFIFFIFILNIKFEITLFIVVIFMLKSLLSIFFSINSIIRRYDEVKLSFLIIKK